MGFFTFLTGEQGDQPPDLTKPVPVPKGAKVRKVGEDFWRGDEQWASESDEIKPEDTTPMAQEGVDFNVDRRAGVKKAHADIASAYGETLKVLSQIPHGGAPGDPEPGPGSSSVIGRQDFRDLGNALVSAQRRDNPIKLADDLRVIASRPTMPPEYAKKLHGAAEKLTKAYQAQGQLEEMRQPGQPLAVTPNEVAGRKEYLAGEIKKQEELLKTAGSIRAPQIQENLRKLREEEGRVNLVTQNAPTAVPTPETPPQFLGPISHFMDGLGISQAQIPGKVHAALTAVGIPSDQWADTNVEPTAGLMRVLGEMDKDGAFAQLIVQQMSLARQQDMADQQSQPPQQGQGQPQPQQQAASGEQADPRIARTEAQIRSREQEIRQLYAQLRESPFMRTWPGIILYVLVGMLTQNPAFAARLIGGVGNRDAVDKEIRGIQFELRRLDHQLERQEREEAYSKREAARRLQHKDDVADQRKWEMSKMMVQHNLIIQRNAARGNPETFIMKKLAGDFQRSLGMASKFQSEMDQYARAMNNELADPKSREDARRKWSDAKRNYDYYMQKAAGVDRDIRGIGGAAAAPEEDSEE